MEKGLEQDRRRGHRHAEQGGEHERPKVRDGRDRRVISRGRSHRGR
jgi:hypothetical protein